MPIIPADLRTAVIATPEGAFVFAPDGVITIDGERALLSFDTKLAARVFVPAPTRRIAGVVAAAREALASESSPIIAQPGAITTNRTDRSSARRGLQPVFFDVDRSTRVAWHRRRITVAEAIAEYLGLAEVVAEIQRAGLRVRVFGVAPRKHPPVRDRARTAHA